MANIPFFFLNKFGISDTVKKRVQDVDEETPGAVVLVTSAELLYGYQVEQFVHSVYFLQNWYNILRAVGLSSLWPGSGHTEWFVNFSPIVGFSVAYLNYRFNLGLIVEDFYYWKYERLGLFFFTPFVWLDGLLWLLVFRSIRFLLTIGIIFLILYFLAKSK